MAKIKSSGGFCVREIERILDSVFSDAWIKAVLSFLAVVFHWMFGGQTTPVLALFGLVVIDGITGIMKAYSNKTLSSRGFRRGAAKFVLYVLMLKACLLFDSVMPLKIPFFDMEISAFAWMSAWLAGTELISILENVGELGWPVPTSLIKHLKVMQKDKNDQA